jgi:hypothetical protein
MHIPRPTSIIRSIGNDGARANAEGALAHWAADRAAVAELEVRLSTDRSLPADPAHGYGPGGSESRAVGSDSA